MPFVWNLGIAVFTSEIRKAQEVCIIEALYTPHVRNVYIQVIHILSAAEEAFVKLVCVLWSS